MSASNPFDDDHAADPFNDPIIASALATSALNPDTIPDSDDDDYGKPRKGNASTNPYRVGPSRPIPLPTEEPRTNGSIGGGKDENLTDRERELRRREQELLERERRLHEEQETMRIQGAALRPPNFPPIYPFMFHDIDIEIPESERQTVRWLFYSWLGLLATLVWNAVGCFLILVSHATGVTTGGSDFGVAFVYCFTITAGSFFLWYRPVYNAYMKERSLYYYIYFVFNGFHIAFCYYMTVGIPATGSAGLINTISMLSDGKIVAGIFGLVAALAWACEGTAALYLYKRVHHHYRIQGHTFADAKGDALSTVVRSDVGRSAMTGYAQSAV